MKSLSKIQFGQLNYKRFYFSNGLVSLPFGHPSLKESIPRLNILGQIYAQTPTLYELNSDTEFLSLDSKTTKELIKNSSWKWLQFMMGSFMAMF